MEKPRNLVEYYQKLNTLGQTMYDQIRSLIFRVDIDVCETLFVSNPYYYLKSFEGIKPQRRPSIMLVYYKDHVNIFSVLIKPYKSKLMMYKVTDNDTLQIYYDKPLMNELLIEIFTKSLKPEDE